MKRNGKSIRKWRAERVRTENGGQGEERCIEGMSEKCIEKLIGRTSHIQ